MTKTHAHTIGVQENIMKIIRQGTLLGAIALYFATAVHSIAIDGLQLSLQCSNVVLTWPSVDGSGDTYIIRRRPDLSTNSTWTMVTNSFPAAAGTNLTVFIDYGVVTNVNCNGSPAAPAAPFAAGTAARSSANVALFANTVAGTIVPPSLPPLPPGLQYSNAPDGSVVIITLPRNATPMRLNVSGFTLSADDGGAGLPGIGDPSPGPLVTNSTPAEARFYEVVKVGVHLFGITNGMVLRGQVPLPVEFAIDATNAVINSVFLQNDYFDGVTTGVAFPDYGILDYTNQLIGVWDTTQVTNGTYQIQIGADLADGRRFTEDAPVSVTVSNLAWTSDPWNSAGQAIYVGIQTPYTDGTGTFHVDVFDDQNTYIGYFNGIIDTNGFLNVPGNPNPGFSFNNTDASGVQNPSTKYTMSFTSDAAHPLSPTPPYGFTNVVAVETPWNFQPTWATICYEDLFVNDAAGFGEQSWTAMISEMAQAEEGPGGHGLLIGTSQYPFVLGRDGTWATVLSLGLQSGVSRDFIYLGHGNNNSIGGDPTTLGITYVTTKFIANSLTNVSSNPLKIGTNAHPYRFVFLDGCNTANGNWPLAFGIPKKTGMSQLDFVNKRGLRPRAFLGWDKPKNYAYINNTDVEYNFFEWNTQFFRNWAQLDSNGIAVVGLRTAINQVTTNTDGSPNTGGRGIVIYGAEDLDIQL